MQASPVAMSLAGVHENSLGFSMKVSGYEELGPKVESWEGERVGKQLSHRKEDC